MINVVEARYVCDDVLWLRFSDGLASEVDLCDELAGPDFEPLRRHEVFQSVRLHPEPRTIVWPNGADFASEFLHDLVRVPTRQHELTRRKTKWRRSQQ